MNSCCEDCRVLWTTTYTGLDKVFFFPAAKSKAKISCQNNLEFPCWCLVFLAKLSNKFRNNVPHIVPNPATMEQNMRQDIGDVKYQTQFRLRKLSLQ